MRLPLVMSLILALISCQTPSSSVQSKATVVDTAVEKQACAKSRGPEVLKNGNFELIGLIISLTGKAWMIANIQMTPQNNLLELDKNQNISQSLNYHAKSYYVKFQYKVETVQSQLPGSRAFRTKIDLQPRKSWQTNLRTHFPRLRQLHSKHQILSDEKVLIDNISVKPLPLSCIKKSVRI